MKKTTNLTIILVIIVALVLCCCMIAILIGVYLSINQLQQLIPTYSYLLATYSPDSTPIIFETASPTIETSTETLHLLEQTIIPINNLSDLACRLQARCDIPETLTPPVTPLIIGAQQTFWVLDTDNNENFQVNAALRYITPHVYFWVQDDIRVREQDMRNLIETFENQIYPTNRAFFGTEWTPGVDGDPHIYILYGSGMGYGILGMFGSTDEFPSLAQESSNAHEMFYLSADTTTLRDEDAYSTLAHEFQHMIQWYQDRNETTWMSEGSAQLAELLNGYTSIGHEYSYIDNPDMQLNDWPTDPSTNSPNYGAGFLFMTYFLDRFGEETTQALVHDARNGLESIDNILLQTNTTDPLTSQPITADDFFLDWVITNYIHDSSVADGRYFYPSYLDSPQANATETISDCPLNPINRTVHQYGVDYIQITCRDISSLRFSGAVSSRLLPTDPHSGLYTFWSNKGDESNMRLTRQFDFSDVSGPITLTYWTWYDIEEDYDYVYLEASNDGQNWDILITPTGTAEDPSGNSYGWGYNGLSNGWIQEMVDLSQYAGQRVYLRFEYVTDAAVNGEGFLLDDIAIPEIGYSEDFESGDGNWQAEGFARLQNVLPQTFRLALITNKPSGTTVQNISLSSSQNAIIPLTIGQDNVNDLVLVVTGTTRFTREQAVYQIEIR